MLQHHRTDELLGARLGEKGNRNSCSVRLGRPNRKGEVPHRREEKSTVGMEEESAPRARIKKIKMDNELGIYGGQRSHNWIIPVFVIKIKIKTGNVGR